MKKYVLGYLATAVVMLGLDGIWLGVVAMPLYQKGIGHLMAAQVNLPAALAFYAMYITGLMVYAVSPVRDRAEWSKVVQSAALFGFFTYATYDLTNLATLNNWPASIVLVDIVWGMFISTAASLAGRSVFRRYR